MRRILVERARAKAAQKRGGLSKRIELDLEQFCEDLDERPADFVMLDEALGELEQHDAQAAELVKLRFFAGLSHQQAATSMGLTRRAADRARAWHVPGSTDGCGRAAPALGILVLILFLSLMAIPAIISFFIYGSSEKNCNK